MGLRFYTKVGAHKDLSLSTSLPTDWWALGGPNNITYFTCVNSIYGLPTWAPLSEHPGAHQSVGGGGKSKDLDGPHLYIKFQAHQMIVTLWSMAHNFNDFISKKVLHLSNDPIHLDWCKSMESSWNLVTFVCVGVEGLRLLISWTL